MKLSKFTKILLLVFTLLPFLIVGIVGWGNTSFLEILLPEEMSNKSFLVQFMLVVLAAISVFGMTIFYLIYLFKMDNVSRVEKVIWTVLLIILSIPGLIIFWYWFVWKQPHKNTKMKNKSVVALRLMHIFKIFIILLLIGAGWFLYNSNDTSGRKILTFSKKERLRIALNSFDTLEEYLENDPSAVEFVDSPDGKFALLSAARNGNAGIAAKLLKLGADPDMRSDYGGTTPLHLAAQYGHLEVAELLWQHGAKTTDAQDDNDDTPLHTAACSPAGVKVEMIKTLLERGADPRVHGFLGLTPLHCIVRHPSHTRSAKAIVAARLLLAYGADVNAEDEGIASYYSKKRGSGPLSQAVPKAFDKKRGSGPLRSAIFAVTQYKSVDMVRFLLDHGADVNQDHALSTASKNFKTEIIKLLVDAGADVNARYRGNSILESIAWNFRNCNDKYIKNNPGFPSALHESVSILLDAGADSNPKVAYSSYSPLGKAVVNGCDLKLIRIFLEAGAKVDARCIDQKTPLYLALERYLKVSLDLKNDKKGDKSVEIRKDKILEVAKVLLAHGADPNTKKRNGVSLLAYAVYFGLTDMAAILLDSGAIVDERERSYNRRTLLYLALERYQEASLDLKNSRTSKESAQFRKDNLLEVAKDLLAHGADPNTKKRNGVSLLAYAVSHGLTDMAAILLESGADINRKIVEMALDKPKMQELLKKHVSDIP